MGEFTQQSGLSAPLYRSLFERSPYPILLVDYGSLHVLQANHAAAAEYGYSQEELADLPLETLWPGGAELLSRRTAALASDEAAQAACRHLRKSGEAIDVAIGLQDIAFSGRPAIALHIRKLTHRSLHVALLEANNRLLELVARGSPLARVLEELVLTMERLSSGMTGSVLLLDADGKHARHGAAPNLPPPYWQAIDGVRIGPAAGSCGTAMYLDRQVIVTDIAVDPLWDDYRALALAHGLRACWSAPVRSRAGKVLGAFAMYYREPGGPSEHDLQLVHAGAGLAALAIERDLSDRALQESESRLRAILDHAFAVAWLKDLDGRYMLVNRRFEQATGVSGAIAIGRTDRQLFQRALAEAYSANDRKVLETRRPIELEEELAQPDGAHAYLTVKFPLLHADGTAYALCCISKDITGRKRAERGLEQSREELRALAAKLHSVREEERVRIAREIHDELGQTLTALRVNQSLLIRSVREADVPDGPSIAAQLESLQGLVTGMLASLRRIVTELRPEVLDTLGLAAALDWQAAEFARRTGIECRVCLPGGAVAADAERSTALFRIVQEALTNAARHAGADRVEVKLRREGAFLEMTVADNGRGITQAEAYASTSLGLLGLRERAAMLGGTAAIAGAPGEGTTITVRLPAS